MKAKNKTVFISEVRNPYTNGTSTQVMTKNLVDGFNGISKELIFVAIVRYPEDEDAVKQYYKEFCSEIFIIPCLSKVPKNAFTDSLSLYFISLINNAVIPSEIAKKCQGCENIVSHSPSIDAVLYASALKKQVKSAKFIEYWSDPMALSLITPSEYTVKRLPLFLTEKRLFSLCDEVIFGTESLYNAEKALFGNALKKSKAVSVSYCSQNNYIKNDKITVGYFGNYYSSVRNILPLYEAFDELPDMPLTICGIGDEELKEKKNVKILSRVPQSEIGELEEKSDVIVCVLNSHGIQIPGKVFYRMNTKQIILVILDGENCESIKNELNKTGRFIFCQNNKESIIKALCDIKIGNYSVDFEKCLTDNSPETVCKAILEQ